jgi:outer membrane lipoprotein-sorting protein
LATTAAKETSLALGRWLLLACVLAGITISQPQAAVPPAYSSGEARADLTRIESYLNSFQTVEAQFVQRSSNGETAQGDLYLARPGRLRIEYQPPTPVIMISNGTILMYYDRELDQFSHIPVSASPASILLEEAIDFDGETIDVVGFGKGGGILQLTVARHENPTDGAVTLVFEDGPLALKRWIITDAQGIETTVSLVDARFDTDLDPDLFKLFNPRFQNR